MSSHRRLATSIALLVALCLTAAVAIATVPWLRNGTVAMATVPFRSHVSSLTTISTSGDVLVGNTGGRHGLVRASYVLPHTWRHIGSLDAATIRFATHNSCGHRVTFTAEPGATGQRIYAEIFATATADPRRECHAGGPRRVATSLADTFAAGSVGGFILTASSTTPPGTAS